MPHLPDDPLARQLASLSEPLAASVSPRPRPEAPAPAAVKPPGASTRLGLDKLSPATHEVDPDVIYRALYGKEFNPDVRSGVVPRT